MFELVKVFGQNLVWSLLLFVVVFVTFTIIFARGQITRFVAGLSRLMWSVVSSPFVFLERATGDVLTFTRDEEQRYRASRQYLLNKAMLVLQMTIILIAVGALSAGVVQTWNVLVPPSAVRRDAREYSEKVVAQRTTAQNEANAVAKLDREWAAVQEAVIAAYRKERTDLLAAVESESETIARELSSSTNPNVPAVFAEMKKRADEPFDDIEQAKRSITRVIYQYWYWLDEASRQSTQRWTDLWAMKARANLELSQVSSEELRRIEQPSYAEVRGKSEGAAETLARMEYELTQREEAASLKWKQAAWRGVLSFVTFLFFVWVTGLLVEGGWLAIRVADDVRQMREASKQSEIRHALTSDTDVDVRLPILDPMGSRNARTPREA